MTTKTLDVGIIEDIDLVNIVNETERIVWRLNHDAADDRIPNEGVDDSIKELMQTRDRTIEEIIKRTGLQTDEQLRGHIKGKLKEQDEMWDRLWLELYKEGAVFRYSKGCPHTFETVRTYLPTSGTIGPNQYILARIHGSKDFKRFDDRDIPELTRLDDVQPIYQEKGVSGIIKEDEETHLRPGLYETDMVKCYFPSNSAFRKEINVLPKDILKNWFKFTQTGVVFSHTGFNETFETFEHFNLPGIKREQTAEVILARSYSRPVFVEFTVSDLRAMKFSSERPKYTRKDGNITYTPRLSLE